MIRLWDTNERCTRHVRHDQIVEVQSRTTPHGGKSFIVLANGSSFYTDMEADRVLDEIVKRRAKA